MTTIYNTADNTPFTLESIAGTALIVTVPAAFSGTCTDECVPGILQHKNVLREHGVERIIVVTSDQPFAIQAWIEKEAWEDSGIEFASDFGTFEMRKLVGKLCDEKGKEEVPGHLAHLLRRSYHIVKDGKITWSYAEPDTGTYTLNIDDLLHYLEM